MLGGDEVIKITYIHSNLYIGMHKKYICIK